MVECGSAVNAVAVVIVAVPVFAHLVVGPVRLYLKPNAQPNVSVMAPAEGSVGVEIVYLLLQVVKIHSAG